MGKEKELASPPEPSREKNSVNGHGDRGGSGEKLTQYAPRKTVSEGGKKNA